MKNGNKLVAGHQLFEGVKESACMSKDPNMDMPLDKNNKFNLNMERMKTSTPISSPLQGKKKHVVQKSVCIDETLGDIESEIQSRRLEAINKSTEGRRRLSTVPLLAGYSTSQLTQHCKDVIKLSTENKINCKNAFNFWLIDAMAAMAKKNDSEINKNFQVASCTLDASVKIYGYRVDAIHTDAVKIAGGFITRDRRDINEEEERAQDVGEEDPKGEPAAKTKLKKKRKKLTIVPPETLNAKTETEVLLDAVPRPNFLTRKTNGNDILIKIPKYNDGGLLLPDSDSPCWPSNSPEPSPYDGSEPFDPDPLMSLIVSVDVTEPEALCSSYGDIEFGKDGREEDSDEEDLQTSQHSGRFEFDANASPGEVSFDEGPDEQRNRMEIPAGGFESDEEVPVRPERRKEAHVAAISDMKYRIALDPLEYSMFDEKTLKAWAGPAHWKVRPTRKPLEECSNQENLLKPAASKRTRKGKIKSRAGLFDTTEDVLEKNLADCEKTTLIKSTMLNWNPQNTTIPKDLKCQSKSLISLYHMPSFSVTFKGEADESGEVSDPAVSDREDLDYCSSSAVREEEEEVEGERDMVGRGDSTPPDEEPCDDAWDEGNMVEAPNKVEKIHVSAFRRKKHVDIKHLKRGLWNVLTNGGETEAENRERVEETVEFVDLIKAYSNKVPKSFGSLITAPLIFNALLHLTNEKCLVLTQNKSNKFNFAISQ